MKVLYVSYNGAMEPLFQSQGIPYIMNARKGGYDFSILTFESDENIRACDPLFLRMKDKFSGAGIIWRYLRFHRKPVFIAKIYDLLRGIGAAIMLSLKSKPDAIHARGLFSALIALPASFIMRKPLVFDTRSKLSEAYAITGKWEKGGIAARIISFLEDLCINSAKAIVVETSDHKAETEEFLSGNKTNKMVEVIPCCVDLERFKNMKDVERQEPGFTIAYLGSLSGWYCLKETLAFFKNMKKTLPESKMVFLTRDDPKEILKDIKEIGLADDAVKIFGSGPDDVPNYLARSSAGIVFKYPNQRLSSFPIKIGEYLASGIPVVINRGMGDVERFVSDNGVGVVIDRFDEDSFSRGVSGLLELIKEKDLRKRCLSAARKLSVETGARKYISVYEWIGKGAAV